MKNTAAHIQCDMRAECRTSATYVEESGFAYCAAHAAVRRSYGNRCRKMRASELASVSAGNSLPGYAVKSTKSDEDAELQALADGARLIQSVFGMPRLR